ncbi:F0F1 ATP synthase subunit epsilon [Leucobacter chromiireducens]|uniref:F0F1 ATP synthase subunit epsilon n=1 Tax=Leucobacter chromiireducens subsp. chromiireducens TaxID=660067 RepID=A0ABS1SQJ4_9MICO|nr:F0F1 ATP synthase subunit epsilon [Leucobacter chromiireducens]MBL3689870.1 F0F1 ATP synthase subunit epsilon [Leucobacter chromiireducens subsp. chromiireducens]
MASLNVSVVSADREVWTGAASQVVARTVEGEIGILAGHEPLLALLGAGEVRVTTGSGEKVTVDAEGGFLSVDHDTVTIVAGKATLA